MTRTDENRTGRYRSAGACLQRLLTLSVLWCWAGGGPTAAGDTQVAIVDGKWQINGRFTNPGSAAEGLLMNVRMVNAPFEDTSGQRPDFDPDANARRFMDRIPEYVRQGVNAVTLCLQGGMPGYEGAVNSAFAADGQLRPAYLQRVGRVIQAADQQGMVIILGCFYQRQSSVLRDAAAVQTGLLQVVDWLQAQGYRNVVLEVANEHPHGGFVHPIIRDPASMAGLLRLVKQRAPQLLVTASGYGNGLVAPEVAAACDFLTPHWNDTRVEDIPARVAVLQRYGKPIVCNEDDRTGAQAVAALQAAVRSGAAYGLMLKDHNQAWPFRFDGAADDPVFYAALRQITAPAGKDLSAVDPSAAAAGFPLPESQGGWRIAGSPAEIASLCEMDPQQLDELRSWLLESDNRPFAAVVIRRGVVALQVERDHSAVTDTGNVKSCAKAICATVLAIAAEESRHGRTPRRMTFDDAAFDLIPWAQPLSDPRKAQITVRQLLNHTSGITPESTRVPNRGPWEVILGHAGDERNQRLAFAPGTDLDYGTHALYHAALVCENVTGQSYEQFTVSQLLQPLGIERWWFEYIDGDAQHGRHASHTLGLSARDLARIGYCLLRNGRWGARQVVPEWFVRETAAPTHAITGIKTFGRDAQSFSHGWELPGLLSGARGRGIPRDARFKPGSGGQLIAFVPGLDLVVARQTGGAGQWEYEEFLRRACAAVR